MLWEWYTREGGRCACNWWHLLHKSIAGHLRSGSVFAGPCSFEWGWIHFRYEVPKCWVHSRGVDSHTPYIVNFISSIWGDRLHGIDWSICCPSSIEVLWIARNPHNFCHINTYGHAVIRTSSTCWWPNKAVVGSCRCHGCRVIPDPKIFGIIRDSSRKTCEKTDPKGCWCFFPGMTSFILEHPKRYLIFLLGFEPPMILGKQILHFRCPFQRVGFDGGYAPRHALRNLRCSKKNGWTNLDRKCVKKH